MKKTSKPKIVINSTETARKAIDSVATKQVAINATLPVLKDYIRKRWKTGKVIKKSDKAKDIWAKVASEFLPNLKDKKQSDMTAKQLNAYKFTNKAFNAGLANPEKPEAENADFLALFDAGGLKTVIDLNNARQRLQHAFGGSKELEHEYAVWEKAKLEKQSLASEFDRIASGTHKDQIQTKADQYKEAFATMANEAIAKAKEAENKEVK